MKNKELVEALKNKNLSLISVESLTAGLFASTICDVPGASSIFKGSIVTYQSSFKEDILGLSHELISNKGVVSSDVAIGMAIAARKYKTDFVISFTGNAGPTTCEGEAPVGRVYMAVLYKNKCQSYEFNFKGERNEIREKCVEEGIELLLSYLN